MVTRRSGVWGYSGGIPKVSVYLPDDLYREARDRALPISALAQEAIRAAVAADRNQRWIERARKSRQDIAPIDTSALLVDVREEFGA